MTLSTKWKKLDYHFKKNSGSLLVGLYQTTFHGNGMEFCEHKLYSPGDPTKDIDWKVSAKTNQIYRKKYEEERDLHIIFVIDTTETLLFGSTKKTKKDLQEEIVYFLGRSALANQDSIGAVFCGDSRLNSLQSGKTDAHLYQIFHTWEQIPYQANETALDESLQMMKKIGLKNHIILILSDRLQWDNTRALFELSESNEVILFEIFDPFESGTSKQNYSFFAKDASQFINIGRSETELPYQKDFHAHGESIKRQFIKHHALVVMLDTSKNTYQTLSDFFLQSRLKSLHS